MSLLKASANAVTAKAHAMYGQMLTASQYAELARKQNLQEIAGYLKEHTHYGVALEDVRGSIIYRRQLETLLHRHVLQQYTKLVHYAGSHTGVYGYILLETEIELILSCIGLLGTQKPESYIAQLPLFIQPHVRFDILSLVSVEQFPQLLELLKGTPYAEILAPCQEPQDGALYSRCELALRRWYFSTLLERAKDSSRGKALKELESLICGRAESFDICAIYRLKKFYDLTPQEIEKRLYHHHWRLTPKQMDTLIRTENSDAFLRALKATSYGKDLTGEDLFLEEQLDQARRRQERRMMRFSTDPQVIYTAFMLLSGKEQENIVRIIEGVHYGMKPERIESLLFLI